MLHANTAVHGNDRQGRKRLCRYGARGPVSETRLRKLDDDRSEDTPKKGVTFTVTAEALVRRLVALVPPPRTHLTSFHGVYAPNAALRPVVTQPRWRRWPRRARLPRRSRSVGSTGRPLHQRTWGTDVLRCPCGGRRLSLFDDRVLLQNTTYAPPRFDVFADPRFLNETELMAKLVDALMLGVTVSVLHDTWPPTAWCRLTCASSPRCASASTSRSTNAALLLGARGPVRPTEGACLDL